MLLTPPTLPDMDVLAKLFGIVFGGIALLVGGSAYIMAWFANRRAKKAEASGRRVDAELAGPEGEPSMRELLVENYKESVAARKAAVDANVSAQRAEGMCGEMKSEIASHGSFVSGEINSLRGQIAEVATTARSAAADATKALQVARALEFGRRGSDPAIVAVVVEEGKS